MIPAGAREVGRRVREVRMASGMNGNEFCRAVGISRSSLQQIENGENYPSLATLLRMCEVLGCSADALTDKGLKAAIADNLPPLPSQPSATAKASLAVIGRRHVTKAS